jgi:hypothetical protein
LTPHVRLWACLAVVAIAAAVTPIASAQGRFVDLPRTDSALPLTPPLPPMPGASGLPLTPSLFVGGLTTRELVVVGVDPAGEPQSVQVLQRIFVRPSGDYVFSLPAPVISVRPGPGTQSTPGQRENELLWQGFSPGRRLLAAWVELRPGESAPVLPVRVRVETSVDGTPLEAGERRSGELQVSLTVENVTGASARSFTAEAEPLSVAQALDELRGAVRRDVAGEGVFVRVLGRVRPVRTRVAVPLRVEGTLSFAPGTASFEGARDGVVRVSGLLDGLRRTTLRLDLRGRANGAAPPKLALRVAPQSLASRFTPPGGGTWVAAFRRGVLGRNGRALLDRAIALELTYARQRQYDMYLASPDPTGPSSIAYVYRTASAPRAEPVPQSSGGDDEDVVWLVLAGLGLLLAVPTAAVVWARS